MLDKSKSTEVLYIMLGTDTLKPRVVFKLSGSGHRESKPSLQSISCRDWWLAVLLILCNKKCHAIDYLNTGIEVMLGGLKPTGATLIIWNYNDNVIFGELLWSCYDLSCTACHGQQCWQNVLMSTHFCLPSTFWKTWKFHSPSWVSLPITTILIANLPNTIWRGVVLACAPAVCPSTNLKESQRFHANRSSSPYVHLGNLPNPHLFLWRLFRIRCFFLLWRPKKNALEESRRFGGWRTSHYFQHSSHVQMLSQKLDSRISTLRKYDYTYFIIFLDLLDTVNKLRHGGRYKPM